MSRWPSIDKEKLRQLVSPLNLHLAAVAVLVAANIYLLVHIAVAWKISHSSNADAVEQQTIQMRAAEIAAKPLRGLDKKLLTAERGAEEFYKDRIPAADSTIIAELGALAARNSVHLSRVQYTEDSALEGLTEIRMDASLSGDYRPLVQFLNGLERDKIFFVIDGVTLTGQQSGVVNLRLRLTSYLRATPGAQKTGTETVTAEHRKNPGRAS